MSLTFSAWWDVFQLRETCLSLVRHMSHLFQLGETYVSPFSAWWDICLTFFSLVRHMSHLVQLGETYVSPFQLGETYVSPFSAWWDICLTFSSLVRLTFFSLVRHMSHLFQQCFCLSICLFISAEVGLLCKQVFLDLGKNNIVDLLAILIYHSTSWGSCTECTANFCELVTDGDGSLTNTFQFPGPCQSGLFLQRLLPTTSTSIGVPE